MAELLHMIALSYQRNLARCTHRCCKASEVKSYGRLSMTAEALAPLWMDCVTVDLIGVGMGQALALWMLAWAAAAAHAHPA